MNLLFEVSGLVKTTTKDKILSAIKLLVTEKPIEQLTVRDFAKKCDISTRSFYNFFYDKYDATTAIYLDYVFPYIHSDLQEWYEIKSDFCIYETDFIKNSVHNAKQDFFIETMKKVEYEKLLMHIKPSIYDDPQARRITEMGILFNINGLLGVMQDSFNKIPFSEEDFNTSFNNNWELISGWMPLILTENLAPSPVRECSNNLNTLFEKRLK